MPEDGENLDDKVGTLSSAVGRAVGTSSANAVGASIAASVGHAGSTAPNRPVVPEIRTHHLLAAEPGQYRISGSQSITMNQEAFARVTHTPESSFNLLLARVTALEMTVAAINNKAPPGIGHNNGPREFEPATAADLAEIGKFAVFLKQQRPITVTSREEVAAATANTNKIADKIKTYLDLAFTEMAKSVGQEIGKQLPRAPLWYALYAALTLTIEAAAQWLHSVPL